jgi:hypothetical protein
MEKQTCKSKWCSLMLCGPKCQKGE